MDIHVPEYATLSSYCIYGNLVYYSYYYLDYIYVTGEVELSDGYKSQICVYDTVTDSSKVIYTIENNTEYIPHLSCNGEQLLFVQEIYMGENTDSKVYLIDLSQSAPQAVSVLIEGNVKTAELVDNYIMWLSLGSDSETNSIYRYDYTAGKTVELIEKVLANTFKINDIENFISICNIEADDRTRINAYDFNGKLVNYHVINSYIVNGECNGKHVVWLQNYMMFFYDYANKEVIGLGYAKDYKLVNDVIISMSSDGVYSYKFGDDSLKRITETDEYCWIDFKNTDGKIYGKWFIPGQYGMSWDEDVVTILQIPIDM